MNLSSLVIPVLLAGVAVFGMGRRVDVYSALTHGAEEGLTVLLRVIPALVGLLTAICHQLGVRDDAVSSPTFSIVNEYKRGDGQSMYHFDFYRIEHLEEALDRFHSQYVTPLFYNNEQALRGLVRYAYIGAMGDFVPMEELPSGKGFVDIAFIPSRPSGQPVLLIELKYNEAVDTAISQIKERRYPEKLLPFADNLLLVAISYDKETKRHACKIAPCTE